MSRYLRENLTFNQARIQVMEEQDPASGGKNLYLKGICIEGDKRNANERIYPRHEIIKAVEKAIGKKNIALGERRKGDSDTLVADNTMARTMLGWAPVHTLDDIIKDLEKWYNSKIYKGYKWNQLSTNTFQQRST